MTSRRATPDGEPADGEIPRATPGSSANAEWQGRADAMYRPPWAAAPQFASRYARLQHRAALDAHLSEWTRPQTP